MTAMSPQQRGGQTRRERTRRQVEDALETLLEVQPYDEIRAGDIVQQADVGTATFYQVIGDKSVAMGALVLQRLQDDLAAFGEGTEATDPRQSLVDLLHLLGRFGFDHPRHARGFCRAYDTGVAHLPVDEVADHPAGELQRLAMRLLSAAARANLCPAYVATGEAAALAVAQALTAGSTTHAEHWRRRVGDLCALLQLDPKDD